MGWLQRMMYGRYGGDQLCMALFVLSILVSFIPFWPARIVSWVLIAWALFRMFSKNIPRRQKENMVFLKVWRPVCRFFSRLFKGRPDAKTHKHFRCPKCRQEVRVPRGKGKINITCPKCGTKFMKKT